MGKNVYYICAGDKLILLTSEDKDPFVEGAVTLQSASSLFIDLKKMFVPNCCTSDKPCFFTVMERKARAISYVTSTKTN